MAYSIPAGTSAEDAAFLRRLGSAYANNPFAFDEKGQPGRNVTAISRALKVHPDYARDLCWSAGERWEDWAPPGEDRR